MNLAINHRRPVLRPFPLRPLRLGGLVLLSALAVSTALAQTPQPVQNRPGTEPWKSIAIPALNTFKPTEPTRVTLPNGVQLFLVEDHELPFINGFIRIRGGSRDEPANKIGLVSLYGSAWRTSGTSTTSGDVLDDQLAAKAATVETGGVASLHLLKLEQLRPRLRLRLRYRDGRPAAP